MGHDSQGIPNKRRRKSLNSFKGPRHPVTLTFQDNRSQHGDFNPLRNCLIMSPIFVVYLGSAVGIASIYKPTRSSTAGPFGVF